MNLLCKNILCIKHNSKECVLVRNLNIDKSVSSKYSWAQEHICESCDCIFYSCNICDIKQPSKKLIIKRELYRHAKIHQIIKSDASFFKETKKRKCNNELFDSQKKSTPEMILSDASETIVNMNPISDNSEESYVTKNRT